MGSHPNATAGGLSGGAGTLFVWLLDKYGGVALDPAAAAGIVVAVTAIVLWVGRRGIKGALRSVWGGSQAKP